MGERKKEELFLDDKEDYSSIPFFPIVPGRRKYSQAMFCIELFTRISMLSLVMRLSTKPLVNTPFLGGLMIRNPELAREKHCIMQQSWDCYLRNTFAFSFLTKLFTAEELILLVFFCEADNIQSPAEL